MVKKNMGCYPGSGLLKTCDGPLSHNFQAVAFKKSLLFSLYVLAAILALFLVACMGLWMDCLHKGVHLR
jgi:hypothetical protein